MELIGRFQFSDHQPVALAIILQPTRKFPLELQIRHTYRTDRYQPPVMGGRDGGAEKMDGTLLRVYFLFSLDTRL